MWDYWYINKHQDKFQAFMTSSITIVSCTRGGEGLGRRLYWPGLLRHLVVYRRWSRCQSVPVGGEQNMKQTTYSFRKWVKFILRLSVAVMWHGRLSAGEEEPKIKASAIKETDSFFSLLSSVWQSQTRRMFWRGGPPSAGAAVGTAWCLSLPHPSAWWSEGEQILRRWAQRGWPRPQNQVPHRWFDLLHS